MARFLPEIFPAFIFSGHSQFPSALSLGGCSTMGLSRKLNTYKGEFLSLKRLAGLPVSKKIGYLSKAVLGEAFRVRTVGALGGRRQRLLGRCRR